MRERVIDPKLHTEYRALSEFLDADAHPAGILTINQRNLPIDIWNDQRGYDTTVVLFNAAITRRDMRFPAFIGDRVTRHVAANRIFVQDPSLYLHDRLTLAWYAGNRKQHLLQGVLSRILSALIPSGQRVITFGPSGGGFAAMYYATRLDNAIAIPVNPQTNIAAYAQNAVEAYANFAWGVTGDHPMKRVPAVTDLTEVYSEPVRNRVWYVQNSGDHTHMARHYRPFMEKLHPRNVVNPVLTYAGLGHVPPDKSIIQSLLSAAVQGAVVPPVLH